MSTDEEPLDADLIAEFDEILEGSAKDLKERSRALVLRAVGSGDVVGRRRLMSLVDHVEGRAFDISTVLALRGPEEGALLIKVLVLLDDLRDIGLTVLSEPPSDVLGEVDRELQALTRMVPQGSEDLPSRASLRKRLDILIVDRLNAMGSAPPQEIAPGAFLRVIAEAMGDLLSRGEGILVDRLSRVRSHLWRSLLERARGLRETPHKLQSFLTTLSDEVNDRGEDVLARAESLPHEAGIRLLESTLRDIKRTLSLTNDLVNKSRVWELKRMRRRVRAAHQDRKVRWRQSRILGRRALRTLELLVFFGIVAVLIILAIDVYGSPSPTTRMTLAWVDAGICLFFLTEFSWRWKLSGWSGSYFLRCFFIDVLPSLPFGLATELLNLHVNPGKADAVRVFRVGRLAKLLRGLRLIRPVFQLYRILAFAMQGMDRLARRNAALMNRNIVLFDPPEEEEEGQVSPAVRLRRFRERVARALRLTLSELPPKIRCQLMEWRVASLEERVETSPHCELRYLASPQNDLRDIRVEAVIEELLAIEATSAEDWMGEESAARLVKLMRLFDVPVIRRLPLLRDMVPGIAHLDPYQAVAQAGHGLGRFLDRLVGRMRFFGDLTGIVTGSQLLDRIGGTLAKATKRPATRLLIFGLASLVVSWLIGIIDPAQDTFLYKVETFLSKVMGKAAIILGAVCLVILGFGRWLRKIAGEATELFEKVAEAQGINLLKLHKLGHREEDLGMLFDRALAPEVRILREDPSRLLSSERAEFITLLPHESRSGVADRTALGFSHEQVLMLYLDYLDGGILHRSNVKSTEQFLGNLDLEAIRIQRLRYGKKEMKRLRQLDLNKDRPIPSGPYLWFRFITESLSQRTARLVIQYNHIAVPLSHRRRVTKTSIQRLDLWLEGKESPDKLTALRLDEAPVRGARFNALHFLTVDEKRDAAIGREFGTDVLNQLRADRRTMVREVFSSYPWELMPRHRRTFNPYGLYFNWLGRGRVIVLPIRIIWATLLWWTRGIRAFYHVVREQLRPAAFRSEEKPRLATLDVALRKINRMHLPVFMASLELRARFDPEYLGVKLPFTAEQPADFGSVREDLDLIGAREHQREEFREARREMQGHVRRLERFLERQGWPKKGLVKIFAPDEEDIVVTDERESLRAVTIAFAIDYQDCRTLMTADRDAERALEAFLSQPGDARPRKWLWVPSERKRLDNWVKSSPFKDRSERDQGLIRRAYATNRGRVRNLIRALDAAGGEAAARKKAHAILGRVALYPVPWSQQLITLRTVQALTCLDILNSRKVVTDLGDYSEPSPLANRDEAP